MTKTFPHARYDALVEETIANLKRLGQLKGGEYAGDDDRLANFRRNAEAWGVPMEVVWGIYAGKHWDAVAQYVKDLTTGKSRERLEPLSSRLDDIIVYCILFKAMLEEREETKETRRPAALQPFQDFVWFTNQPAPDPLFTGFMPGDP